MFIGNTYSSGVIISKIIIHSQFIPTYYETHVKHDFDFTDVLYPKNYTLSVVRSSRQYLGSPYGQCSDYRNSNSDIKSRQQCYRNCFRLNIQKEFQCIPLFVDYFVSELDFISNTTKFCLKSYKEFQQKFRDKCMKLCPKECLRVEYSYRITESDSRFGIDYWLRQEEQKRLYSKSIEWDSSEPMFVYSEGPVMSLSDYLVNFGGLMGLWFGISVKDLIFILTGTEFYKKISGYSNSIRNYISNNY